MNIWCRNFSIISHVLFVKSDTHRNAKSGTCIVICNTFLHNLFHKKRREVHIIFSMQQKRVTAIWYCMHNTVISSIIYWFSTIFRLTVIDMSRSVHIIHFSCSKLNFYYAMYMYLYMYKWWNRSQLPIYLFQHKMNVERIQIRWNLKFANNFMQYIHVYVNYLYTFMSSLLKKYSFVCTNAWIFLYFVKCLP